MLAASDGHAKNFSIFLYPGGGFRLTPLYDVLSAQVKAKLPVDFPRQLLRSIFSGIEEHLAVMAKRGAA